VTNEVGLDQPEIVRYGLQDEGRYFVRSRTRSLLAPDEADKVKSALAAQHGAPILWDATDETGEQIRVKFENARHQGRAAGHRPAESGIRDGRRSACSPRAPIRSTWCSMPSIRRASRRRR
jgi:hypothetical protein